MSFVEAALAAPASSDAPWDATRIRSLLGRVLRRCATRAEVIDLLTVCSHGPLDPELGLAFVDEISSLTPTRILPGAESAVNVVGTGQGIATFNISTAAAIVASSAGASVLKSGSAAHSSRCGAIDVLGALGVAPPTTARAMGRMLSELGIAFIPESHYSVVLLGMASLLRPHSFRDVGRFVNTIGPLLCPYRVRAQLTGVARIEDLDALATIAQCTTRADLLLVHAEVGMDEFCSASRHRCCWVSQRGTALDPEWECYEPKVGLLDELSGGDPSANARQLRDVIAGRCPGAAQDTVALNAGALLRLSGEVASFGHGVEVAERAIADGAATLQLQRIIDWTSPSRRGAA